MADKPRLFQPVRNSRLLLEEVYFWTTTVKDWKHLLKPDKYKQLVLDVWRDPPRGLWHTEHFFTFRTLFRSVCHRPR